MMVVNRRIIYKCRMCHREFSPGTLLDKETPDSKLLLEDADERPHYCDGGGGPRIGIADKIGMRKDVL